MEILDVKILLIVSNFHKYRLSDDVRSFLHLCSCSNVVIEGWGRGGGGTVEL